MLGPTAGCPMQVFPSGHDCVWHPCSVNRLRLSLDGVDHLGAGNSELPIMGGIQTKTVGTGVMEYSPRVWFAKDRGMAWCQEQKKVHGEGA